MTWMTWVAARPDGDFLAVATSEGWLGVWLPIDNRIVATHALGASVNKVAWTADGRYLVATLPDELLVLSADGSERLGTIATGHGGLRSFAVHPTQPIVATTGRDGHARLWDVATRSPIRGVLADHAKSAGTAIELTERAVTVGYESGRFAACDHEDRWITSGKVYDAYVSALAASADGASLLIASGRGGMFRMDTTADGWPDRENYRHPPKPIATNAIQFAPDGRFVTALSDDTAVLYDKPSDLLGSTLGTPCWRDRKPWEQAFIVSAACFVPGTRTIATSHFTGHVRLWDRRRYRTFAVTFVDGQPRWEGEVDPAATWAELAAK